MADPLLALLRFLHIGGAVLWLGAGTLLTFWIAPAAAAAGPAGGQFMGTLLTRRRFVWVIPTAATVTVLAGAWLYLELGYAGPPSGRASWILNLAVLAGLIAAGIGLLVSLPTVLGMRRIAEATAAGGGPPSADQMATLQGLQQRLRRWNHVWALFAYLALFAMSTFQFL